MAKSASNFYAKNSKKVDKQLVDTLIRGQICFAPYQF